MSHAAEGLLQAYMDGEVTGPAEVELERHLAGCAVCQTGLQRLRAEQQVLDAALSLLDRPLPDMAVQQAYWRVRAQGGRSLRRVPAWGTLARAAGLLLLLSGGVMAVIPDSPLRRMAAGLLGGSDRPAVERPVAEAPGAPVAVPSASEMAGVTLVPSEGRIQLRVWAAAPSATIGVTLVDGPRVSVQAGGEARFRSASGRIEVMNVGSATVAIEIPRSLPFASIEVNGRQWLFKDGDQLRLSGPVVEQETDRVVFRATE